MSYTFLYQSNLRNFSVELEKLNAATDEINKLELELDESTKTFHLLLAETSRRLQALSKRLGSCVDKSRPYYDAGAAAAAARADCQKAAVQFQRASGECCSRSVVVEFMSLVKELHRCSQKSAVQFQRASGE
ncbi:unnamed protein product [Plutella xylostella]|uniref:(diamondback moth) hypothetical protein n=1 Tax=Plutella xylostella TaxID=51655 RepID=A0A8S4EH76_PLUXY|nr:unnamed protein product [Plutella xylostella]